MRWSHLLIPAVTGLLFMASCDDGVKRPTDNLSSGTIDISVDETYKPVIEAQLKVFDSSYPEAHINVHYKPEAECFKDYFENKARLILVTRQLSATEKELADQKQIAPSSLLLAKDAIAVIVNKSSNDSMDKDELKGILTGAYKKKYTVVFDNQNSSTVRYILDSLIPGSKLGSNVFAAKGNNEVVDYVSKNPDAIGFVGLNYVIDAADSNNTGAFTDRVNVVAIKNDSDGRFYKPYQAYIGTRYYSLTRNLYYINRETWQGLGSGFANFLTQQQGQLIFYHQHLFPWQMHIVIREAEINP
ncbi:MAG: substrate-binding domain-containing protein [Flavipsychrobacter sp.]|nr:substrate-binding domain-containing protein [Flavipsychrobacter sp.]